MKLRVKELCKQKGITQKELAKLIGITPVGLAKSLSGNTTLATLEKIACALGVSVSALLDEETQQNGLRVSCPHCGKSISVSVSVKQTNTETGEKEQSK